ncbi:MULTISPECIES: hypothetical protein [Rhodococcus]|uniref:hypothetical protein n=1 Tax=Rhodococcus TaxID=1827 RepID=UPI00157FAC58|nr:hypothetical protein [Rhodococcus koreensis]
MLERYLDDLANDAVEDHRRLMRVPVQIRNPQESEQGSPAYNSVCIAAVKGRNVPQRRAAVFDDAHVDPVETMVRGDDFGGGAGERVLRVVGGHHDGHPVREGRLPIRHGSPSGIATSAPTMPMTSCCTRRRRRHSRWPRSRSAFGHEAEDLAFTGRQRVDRAAVAVRPGDHPAHHAGVDGRAARGDAVEGVDELVDVGDPVP